MNGTAILQNALSLMVQYVVGSRHALFALSSLSFDHHFIINNPLFQPQLVPALVRVGCFSQREVAKNH
jgi:uncharacterized membrane protein YhfC